MVLGKPSTYFPQWFTIQQLGACQHNIISHLLFPFQARIVITLHTYILTLLPNMPRTVSGPVG